MLLTASGSCRMLYNALWFSSFLLHHRFAYFLFVLVVPPPPHSIFYYYFVFAFTVKLGNTDYPALCYGICSLGRYYALLHPLGGPIILKIRWGILDVNCHWGLGNLCYVLALLVLDWYFAFPYLLWSLTGILIF
jgi:hypothetical protein